MRQGNMPLCTEKGASEGADQKRYEVRQEIFGYMPSIDFRFGSYEDLGRMEDLSERIKMGIDKE